MSDSLLLDTDIVSYLLKNDSRTRLFSRILEGRLLALSFMSEAELYRWSIQRGWGPRRVKQLRTALRRYVILPYDSETGWAWAEVMARCATEGRTMAPSDAWIAATALRHELPLLTHNWKHFEAAEELCDLRLVKPEASTAAEDK